MPPGRESWHSPVRTGGWKAGLSDKSSESFVCVLVIILSRAEYIPRFSVA